MNQVQLFGRLTRDPELRYTQSGKAVANFTLAINRFGGNNEADFFDCTAWDKQAELISNSCQKGHRLLVWGRLQQEKWTDQQTQQQRSKVAVTVSGFSFIEPAPQGQGQQPQAGPPAHGQQPGYQQPPQTGYGNPPGYIPPNPGAYPPAGPPQGQYGQPPQGQYSQPPAGPPQGQYAGPPQGAPPQGQGYQQPAGPPQQGGYSGNLNDIPF